MKRIEVKHNVGTYNVQYGHPIEAHAEMILKRFEDEKLDVLALVEVADYVHALSGRAELAGHHLIFEPGPGAVRNQALLVRGGHKVEHEHSIPMDATYFAPGGALRHSEPPLAVHVDGILYVVVHTPVGAWTPSLGGRRFLGPIRRRIAFHKYVDRLGVVFVHHQGNPVVILGDWNTTPDASGNNSAKELAAQHGARVLRPGASTGHGEIDFFVVRGVIGAVHVVPNATNERERSDHLLVVGTIIWRR